MQANTLAAISFVAVLRRSNTTQRDATPSAPCRMQDVNHLPQLFFLLTPAHLHAREVVAPQRVGSIPKRSYCLPPSHFSSLQRCSFSAIHLSSSRRHFEHVACSGFIDQRLTPSVRPHHVMGLSCGLARWHRPLIASISTSELGDSPTRRADDAGIARELGAKSEASRALLVGKPLSAPRRSSSRCLCPDASFLKPPQQPPNLVCSLRRHAVNHGPVLGARLQHALHAVKNLLDSGGAVPAHVGQLLGHSTCEGGA